MNRTKLGVSLLLVVASAAITAVAALVMWQRLAPGPSPERAAYQRTDGALPVLWPVPAFSFAGHDGSHHDARSLRGQVWIADFMFTTCTSVCPLITAQMVLLQRSLPDPRLRFVSFSVDPANDSVAALDRYRADWNATESRWSLLRPEPSELQSFASGMRVAVEPLDDPDNPILHSSMFFLVDMEGNVRGAYDSNDDEALLRLRLDANRLLGAQDHPASAAAPRSPSQLSEQLGCNACHTNPKLAPPFRELAHEQRALEGGGMAAVNAQYVRQSILAPGAQVALGYLKLMPSYEGHMTDAELDGLVAYLLEQASTAPTAAIGAETSPARIEVDPVCAMQVRVTDETLRFEHQGKEYYFCAKSCRHRFEQNPAEFLKGE